MGQGDRTQLVDMFRQTLESLAPLWPLWLLIAAIGATRAALWVVRERRLSRAGIREIDEMGGMMFERRLVWLFRALGYRVERVGRRGDYGADLLIERDGERVVVQAKRWTKNVGVKAVQEAHAAPAMYGCSRSLVVTNRHFTEGARKLARANGVELWDRERLVDALLRAESRAATAELAQ